MRRSIDKYGLYNENCHYSAISIFQNGYVCTSLDSAGIRCSLGKVNKVTSLIDRSLFQNMDLCICAFLFITNTFTLQQPVPVDSSCEISNKISHQN